MLESLGNSCHEIIQIRLRSRLPASPTLRVVEGSPKPSACHQYCLVIGSGFVLQLVSDCSPYQGVEVFLQLSVSFIQFKLVVVRYLSGQVFLVLAPWRHLLFQTLPLNWRHCLGRWHLRGAFLRYTRRGLFLPLAFLSHLPLPLLPLFLPREIFLSHFLQLVGGKLLQSLWRQVLLLVQFI